MAWGLGAALAFATVAPTTACTSDSGSEDGNEGGSGGGDKGGSGGSSKGGSGGSSKGGSGGSPKNTGPGAQKPASDSNDDILAFLKDGEFEKGGWVSDVAAPRGPKGVSTHDRVRVFFNEAVVASQAAGRGAKGAEMPYDTDSVVVKAFYDADDKSAGWTLLWKATEGGDEPENWRVFCVGSKKACVADADVTEDEPVSGTLKELSQCYGCHHKDSSTKTGLINTAAPQ